MPTPTKGPRLGGSPAHERLILANLATALFEHGRITTTEAKAKRLRPLAERLITFAKRGDLHARRRVLTVVRDKGVVHALFTEIAPDVRRAPGWLHPDHQDRPAQGRQRAHGRDRAGRASRCRPKQATSARPRRPRGTRVRRGRRRRRRDGRGRRGPRPRSRRGRRRCEADGRRDRGRRRPRRRAVVDADDRGHRGRARPPADVAASRRARTPTRPAPRPTEAVATPSEAAEPHRDARRARSPPPGTAGSCASGSTSPTTGPASPAGPRQPGRRTVEGELDAALARVLRAAEPAAADGGRAAPTPACTRAGQVATPTCPDAWARCRPVRRSTRGGAAPARRRAARRRAGAPRRARAAGLRRPVLRAGRRYALPGLRRPGAADPLRRHDTLRGPRARSTSTAMHEAARGRCSGSTTSRRSAGGARARRRSARCSTSPGTRDADGDRWSAHGRGRRVLPLDGARAGRRAARRSARAAAPVGWPREVLRAGVRDAAVVVMPPHGLTLEEVDYPPTPTGRRAVTRPAPPPTGRELAWRTAGRAAAAALAEQA